MDEPQIRRALQALGAELARRKVMAKIWLVGGAVMVTAFRARESTDDIEAGIYPADQVRHAADTVGRRLGLPEGWLNDQAKVYMPVVGEPRWVPVARFGSLEVVSADERTMLAMKLRASRGRRDEGDIRFLLQRIGLTSAEQVVALYDEFFPEDPLPRRAVAIVEDALRRGPAGKARCPGTNADGRRCRNELLPGSRCAAHAWRAPG